VIPRDFVFEWRDRAPWVLDRQLEQDLVISRALVELFSHPAIADSLAFRGGSALYKLHLTPAACYSEDIDLVQSSPGAIGPILDAIRSVLDPWLGPSKWKQTEGRVTLAYRFESEEVPPVPLRLKVESTRASTSACTGSRISDSRWPRAGSPASRRCRPTPLTSCSAPSFARSTSARRAATSSTSASRSSATTFRPSASSTSLVTTSGPPHQIPTTIPTRHRFFVSARVANRSVVCAEVLFFALLLSFVAAVSRRFTLHSYNRNYRFESCRAHQLDG
jgi:hypothetical protein